MMTPEERDELIERYGEGPELLYTALENVPDEALTFRPAPGEWSVHEIIVHLADSEANAALRCRMLIAEPGRQVMAYDQNVWAERLDYHAREFDPALELVDLVRQSTYELLTDLPEEVWGHSVEHSEFDRPFTFEDWLRIYSAHIPDHIAQIEANVAAWEGRGATR